MRRISRSENEACDCVPEGTKELNHVADVLVADLLLHNGGGGHHRGGQVTVALDSQSNLSPSPHFRCYADTPSTS